MKAWRPYVSAGSALRIFEKLLGGSEEAVLNGFDIRLSLLPHSVQCSENSHSLYSLGGPFAALHRHGTDLRNIGFRRVISVAVRPP